MNQQQRVTAIRLLREQEVEKTMKNKVIRDRFGGRITLALTAECEARDREIEALQLLIAMVEDLPEQG